MANHQSHDCLLNSSFTRRSKKASKLRVTGLCAGNSPVTGEFPAQMVSKGAVTCAVCPESAWLVAFLIGNVSTGVVTWSALRCGASGESGKKVAAAPLSKTAAAAAAAKTWFAKHPLDYMLHNRFPWKRSGRRSSMWPPYSLRRNLSAAACRPCDRSFTRKMFEFDNAIIGISMATSKQQTHVRESNHTNNATFYERNKSKTLGQHSPWCNRRNIQPYI